MEATFAKRTIVKEPAESPSRRSKHNIRAINLIVNKNDNQSILNEGLAAPARASATHAAVATPIARHD